MSEEDGNRNYRIAELRGWQLLDSSDGLCKHQLQECYHCGLMILDPAKINWVLLANSLFQDKQVRARICTSCENEFYPPQVVEDDEQEE